MLNEPEGALSPSVSARFACMLAGAGVAGVYGVWKLRAGADAIDVRYGAPIYGVFVYWALLRLGWSDERNERLIRLDVLAVALAASRVLVAFVPFSGHVVFLVYSWGATRERAYRIAAGLVLLDTTYIKWFHYRDALTWGGGVAIAWLLLRRRRGEIGLPACAAQRTI